jgi:hypothetical protein
MKVQGLEPGHEVEIPSEALQPNPTSAGTPGGWQYVWDHDGLLTMRDIIVNFPAKESPTAFAERVSAKAVEMLPVARLAPLFLALYLAALYLTGLPRTDRRRTIETLGLLALAFLAFYPLFVFGSAYLGRGPALWTALAITAGLSALYALSAGGASLAGRSALLQAVLLGAFTYACLDRALTGIIITAGVVVLLGCVMASSARRLRETP